MNKLPNIEKNTQGPGYRGWDRGKRLWQINRGENSGRECWVASNGEKWLYTATLQIMSDTLAVTNIQYEGFGFARRELP